MQKTITDYFLSLVQIDSESMHEKAVAEQLLKDLEALGISCRFDDAHIRTGGECGNLYAYIPGSIDKEPLLFCSHMDTVVPGKSIHPHIHDGLITTDGTTVLGSDDKSGIAEIIWAVKDILESGEAHAPIELLFTISEEIGLLGAKYLNYHYIQSKMGYALDAHYVGEFMVGAPSQNSFHIVVHGKEAHAGVAPEKGINAIAVASEAINAITWGRIDHETTCNIGVIEGGMATNIVPNKVSIKGEVRSHNQQKLDDLTKNITDTFRDVCARHQNGEFKASAEIEVHHEYSTFFFENSHPVVQLATEAANKLHIPVKAIRGGGGSDANIFNGKGIQVIAVGTGMDKVHTVEECIRVEQLELGYQWVREVIRLYSQS